MTEIDGMPELVVDRSPELMRQAGPDAPASGTPVSYRVSVRDAFREAVPGDGARCVIARAVQQAWPGSEPHIEGEHPYVVLPDGRRIDLMLSRRLIKELGKFDRGEPAFTDLEVLDFWSAG